MNQHRHDTANKHWWPSQCNRIKKHTIIIHQSSMWERDSMNLTHTSHTSAWNSQARYRIHHQNKWKNIVHQHHLQRSLRSHSHHTIPPSCAIVEFYINDTHQWIHLARHFVTKQMNAKHYGFNHGFNKAKCKANIKHHITNSCLQATDSMHNDRQASNSL